MTGTLETIAGEVRRAELAAPAIVVIGEVVALREKLRWFDRMPLFGKRVLITRPAEQAHEFARALYARGVEPILASTIAIVPPDDVAAAHRAIDDLASYRVGRVHLAKRRSTRSSIAWPRLTATRATSARPRSQRSAARPPSGYARSGCAPTSIPAAFVSEEIGRALMQATHTGDRILIYRAQEARDVLPQMLEDAGREPHVVAAYKTIFDVDPEFAQKVQRADVLTFTSASTVRGYVELLGGATAARDAARNKLIACIGPITAEAADEAGLHVDVVADVFTTEGLLDALEAHFAFLA